MKLGNLILKIKENEEFIIVEGELPLRGARTQRESYLSNDIRRHLLLRGYSPGRCVKPASITNLTEQQRKSEWVFINEKPKEKPRPPEIRVLKEGEDPSKTKRFRGRAAKKLNKKEDE